MEFLDACRHGLFRPAVGPVVVQELSRSGEPKRSQLLSCLQSLDPIVFDIDSRADELAQQFLAFGAGPPSKPDDAAHVGYAFVNRCDVLVSWNFKHIASLRRAEKFNAAALLRGYDKRLIITTPAELLYGDESER